MIYPEYCHDASPTLLKWCPLRARDIHGLRDVGIYVEGRRLYHYGNHPVKWVRTVGVVVAVDGLVGRLVYTLDDGSGMCVECVCVAPAPPPLEIVRNVPSNLSLAPKVTGMTADHRVDAKRVDGGAENVKQVDNIPVGVLNPTVPWDDIDVGSVVKVKGRVGSFRDVMQVEVVRVEVVGCTDGEVKHWEDALVFMRDVLGKPWIVTAEEEEKVRRRQQRDLRKARKGVNLVKEKDMGQEGKMKVSEGDAVQKVLREESRRKEDREEARRKRKEEEQKQRHEEKVNYQKQRDGNGLNPVKKRNFPSLAVRRAAAGKYDALGI